jgi:hypothetical protein
MRFGQGNGGPILVGALTLVAFLAAGCDHKERPKIDPNLFPTDYKAKILKVLQTSLTDRTSFFGAAISQPMLKPFGTENRYVVCVRLSGNRPGEKVAIFFGGELNQFVEATEDVCKGVVYEPFPELERR